MRVVRPVPEALLADRRRAVALRQRVREDVCAQLGWQRGEQRRLRLPVEALLLDGREHRRCRYGGLVEHHAYGFVRWAAKNFGSAARRFGKAGFTVHGPSWQ